MFSTTFTWPDKDTTYVNTGLLWWCIDLLSHCKMDSNDTSKHRFTLYKVKTNLVILCKRLMFQECASLLGYLRNKVIFPSALSVGVTIHNPFYSTNCALQKPDADIVCAHIQQWGCVRSSKLSDFLSSLQPFMSWHRLKGLQRSSRFEMYIENINMWHC